MLSIHPVPAFKDNYIWIIHNRSYAIVVDPGTASPVIDYLQFNQLQLSAILITHHHHDHTGGIRDLLRLSEAPVYGPVHEAIPDLTHSVQEGDLVHSKELSLSFRVLDIPGHTLGHLAYVGSSPFPFIFCGDTLFACGCGRVFEGSAKQMYESLDKISQLPDDTLIYCTHEYTLDNIRFARVVDPDNSELIKLEDASKKLRHQNLPTIPTTLILEKTVNPFLRCHQPEIIHSAENYVDRSLSDPASVFTVLRGWKNNF